MFLTTLFFSWIHALFNNRRGLPLNRRWLLGLIAGLALLTSSCFQADVTLHFDQAAQGKIQEQIYLSPNTVALSGSQLDRWTDQLRQSIKKLGGQIQVVNNREIRLQVPFNTEAELTAGFQQLFAPVSVGTALLPIALDTLPVNFEFDQKNYLFALRNHLVLDLDLSSLPAKLGPATADNQSWLNLTFHLQTPWGLSQVLSDSQPPRVTGNDSLWLVAPGGQTHIDVVFWTPGWVGLGTLVIMGLVVLGYILK